MFIRTESTPNPHALKFLPGCPVMANGTLDIRRADDAAASPLARLLLDIDGVEGLLLGPDFISVTKAARHDWGKLRPQLQSRMMDFFMAGQPVMAAAANANSDIAPEKLTQPHVPEILAALDEYIRPGVAKDGGDVKFIDFDQGVLYLEMRGACAHCPAAGQTLKLGIEKVIRHIVPAVTEVVAV